MKAVLPNANSRLPSTSARMMKMMRVVRGLPWAGIDKGDMALMRGLRWRRVRPGLRHETDHAWAERSAQSRVGNECVRTCSARRWAGTIEKKDGRCEG